jgi:hypothetical protein
VGPAPVPPPHTPPRKKTGPLAILGVGCLAVGLCVAIAFAGSCAACVAWSDPGDLTYHASGGSCWLDVVFIDEDGKEVRRGRVRGGSGPRGTSAWTNAVDLEAGDPFKISVIPADESCTVEPVCWVTFRDRQIVPRTTTRRHPDGGFSALCEGTIPR